VSIAIATLWVAAGSHCLLEVLPGLEFLSCCEHGPTEQSPAHHETDCAGDGCAAIESGFYKVERPRVAPVKPLLPLVAWLTTVRDNVQFSAAEPPDIASVPPAELCRIWQFTQRTALPPRAPTFVS
jgi:hypothetical protein